jgi:hypothetical protein
LWFVPAIVQAVAYYQLAVVLPAFPAFVYGKFKWRSAPCSTPFSGALSAFLPPLLCASFQFVVYYSVVFFFFFFCRRVSLPRGLC